MNYHYTSCILLNTLNCYLRYGFVLNIKLLLNYHAKQYMLGGISAVVKFADSCPCGWGSIPGKSCSFFIVFLSKGLSLCLLCSDQHVKYLMGFLWLAVCYWITTHIINKYCDCKNCNKNERLGWWAGYFRCHLD